jgi:hypothetical protein
MAERGQEATALMLGKMVLASLNLRYPEAF